MQGSRLRQRLGFTGLGTWFSADPRALGLFRIVFGVLAIADVLRRLPYITMFYSNHGLVPNHWELFSGGGPQFSLMLALSEPGEIQVFFGLTLIFLLLFTVGWYTRVFQVLSALCMWSIHARLSIIENGGDVVMNLWWLWTLALPLGRRLSLDSMLADLKARPDKFAGALNARPAPDRAPVWSISILAVLLQLSVIYFFNTVHKSGNTWKDGTAVAWVLEQDRILTGFGAWVRDTLPLGFTKMLTWGTLVIEGVAPILLLTPIFTVWARRIIIFGLLGLHGGILVMTDVGYFSHVMMVSYILLLSARDIELIKRLIGRLSAPATVVHYDSDCGVCTLVVRVLARLDRLGRLTFHGREPDAPTPPGMLPADFEAQRELTVFAWRPGSDRVYARHEAIGAATAALPLGRLVAWIAFIPGLGALFGKAYDAFAARRHRVSAWLGMGLCGFGPKPTAEDPPAGPSAARRAVNRVTHLAVQGFLVFGLVCTGSQLLIENAWARKHIEFRQPRWAAKFVKYGRFFQGWSMFAPNAPTGDGALVIEALLADGRIVDPQTGVAPVLDVADASRMAWDQFWGSYSLRIASGRHTAMRKFFVQWMLRPGRHLELGAEDRIVGFRATWIGDRSPRPKSGDKPRETERYVVMEGGRKLPKP